jgi:hypothetical protein
MSNVPPIPFDRYVGGLLVFGCKVIPLGRFPGRKICPYVQDSADHWSLYVLFLRESLRCPAPGGGTARSQDD